MTSGNVLSKYHVGNGLPWLIWLVNIFASNSSAMEKSSSFGSYCASLVLELVAEED